MWVLLLITFTEINGHSHTIFKEELFKTKQECVAKQKKYERNPLNTGYCEKRNEKNIR